MSPGGYHVTEARKVTSPIEKFLKLARHEMARQLHVVATLPAERSLRLAKREKVHPDCRRVRAWSVAGCWARRITWTHWWPSAWSPVSTVPDSCWCAGGALSQAARQAQAQARELLQRASVGKKLR